MNYEGGAEPPPKLDIELQGGLSPPSPPLQYTPELETFRTASTFWLSVNN